MSNFLATVLSAELQTKAEGFPLESHVRCLTKLRNLVLCNLVMSQQFDYHFTISNKLKGKHQYKFMT